MTALSLAACNKSVDDIKSSISGKKADPALVPATVEYLKYTIEKGAQYCDQNGFKNVQYDTLSFKVKFDSSAIYQTVNPNNQTDINKLFGFSDNNAAHHDFSARFGWNWSNNALRLFGYIYNNGVMSFKELGQIAIGTENNCVLKVSGDTYIFTLNGQSVTMPRASTTAKGQGYKLYPYFGGDETAPHNIEIWIKEL